MSRRRFEPRQEAYRVFSIDRRGKHTSFRGSFDLATEIRDAARVWSRICRGRSENRGLTETQNVAKRPMLALVFIVASAPEQLRSLLSRIDELPTQEELATVVPRCTIARKV